MSESNPSGQSKPSVVTTIAELRQWIRAARSAGKSIGLVPTMGALHEGHLSLVRGSQAACDLTIVTIFVNPTQFGPREDYGKYPRTLEADLDSLRTVGADLVFVPANDEMYPADFSTYVDPARTAQRWEGECRPGHFRGVATIVLKLFNVAQADIAFFGQKDYQQVAVIRSTVRDLNVPVEIRVCPTVREPDGLAMSSRNRYLSLEERRQAVALSRGLKLAEQLASQGQRDTAELTASVRQVLREAGITQIDYIAVVDPESLEPVAELDGPAVALIAARVGGTRLIDNGRIGE